MCFPSYLCFRSGGGSPLGLVHILLMCLFTLGRSKMGGFKICLLDIVTTQNDRASYVWYV